MENKNKLLIDMLDDEIRSYSVQLQEAKNTKVMVLKDAAFIESFDEQKVKAIELRINELLYIQEKYKIEGKAFPFYDRKTEEIWDNYKNSLEYRLSYIKAERTEKIRDARTGNIEFIANQSLVRKLEYINTESSIEHLAWSDEHKKSLIKVINSLLQTTIAKILITIAIFFLIYIVLPYVINRFLISDAPFNIKVAQDNDWIGFWASYISGTIGAIIGGYIALKIASYQFTRQNQNDKINRFIELKLSNARTFSNILNTLNLRIDKVFAYTKTLNDIEVENKLTIESLEIGLKKIDDSVSDVFDILEIIGVEVNSNRLIFFYSNIYFAYIQTEVLKLIRIIKSIRDYYENILNYIRKDANIEFDKDAIGKTLKDTLTTRNDIKYEIYYFEAKIQEEISKILYPEKLFRIITREKYVNG